MNNNKQAWYRQLHWQIIIGLSSGLVWGLMSISLGLGEFTLDFIKPLGDIFVQLLKFIAIPLVLVSLIAGIARINDISKVSRMGGKTLGLYLFTTAMAISLGLLVVNIIEPGENVPESVKNNLISKYKDKVAISSDKADDIKERTPLQFVVDIIPSNFFQAASNNRNMLQIVFVALLAGIALLNIKKDKRSKLINTLDIVDETMIKIVDMVMLFAPYGVFGLMAGVIVDMAGSGLDAALQLLYALFAYGLTVMIGLLLQVLLVYFTLLKAMTKRTIKSFFIAFRPALLLAFSSSSSAATLPVTMKCATSNYGVDEEVSSFVLPIGATVNMDGTSLYQAVAAVFIAQVLGMDLTFLQQLSIILTAMAASIGTAAVPGAGLIMLVIVLQSINIPVEGIALILGIDRILDMFRTMVNVTGDSVITSVIARSENKLSDIIDVSNR